MFQVFIPGFGWGGSMFLITHSPPLLPGSVVNHTCGVNNACVHLSY